MPAPPAIELIWFHHSSPRARGCVGWRQSARSPGSRWHCPGCFVSSSARPSHPLASLHCERSYCLRGRARSARSNGTKRVNGSFTWGRRWRQTPPSCRPGPSGWGFGSGFCGSPRLQGHDPSWWRRRPAQLMRTGASHGVSTGTCAGVPGAPAAPLLPSGPRFEVRHAPIKIIRLAATQRETFTGVQGLFSSKGAGVLL